jgi:stearoyl-CoA desaturase (delta-9 desaturase)
MSTTVTQTVTRENALVDVAKEHFLAADFDEVIRLREEAERADYRLRIVWRNVALFAVLHLTSLLGLYQLLFTAKWLTVGWVVVCWTISGVAITAGAHRLWAHKSYKAKLPLRIILVAMNCVAFQNDVIEWARDHRCHHKWTDTDADPHNVNRGFFFSHMGWLLTKKHPKIKEMGAKLDLSDLTSDPLLKFQRKYYLPLVIIGCFLFPTVVPVYFWGESAFIAFYTSALFRYCLTLHFTWLINSAAHTFGYRPYDVNITPAESVWTTVTAFGEGGHNYHHTFPQDYRTSEMAAAFNLTKLFIDFFAAIGWAYDLKTVSDEAIDRQMSKQLDQLKKQKAQ